MQDNMRGDAPLATLTLDPVTWKQAGMLVLDGSGSMELPFAEQGEAAGQTRTKGAAVDDSVKGFFARMDASSVKPNFSFGLVAFDDKVTHQRAPEPIASIDYLSQSFDPTAHSVTGGTSIYEGLEAAYGLTRDWLAAEEGTLPVTAVIAVLTDGECSNPARTRDLAERIKAEEPRISIAAGMFATKGQGMPGTQLLQAIVTEPRLYAVIYSSEQLREWFHASLTGTGLAARKAQ